MAGSGSAAFTNGPGVAASFSGPKGVAIDSSGIAYVADVANHRVRQIVMSTGAVTTLAGSGTAASTDGTGTAAAFSGPASLALDGLGNLYVTDTGAHRIRKVVLATQVVTTMAGTGAAAFLDGIGIIAAFNNPQGIACDANGNAYVADTDNRRIRKVVLSSGAVTTLAGTSDVITSNGVGSNAGFVGPRSVVVDASGTLLFVSDGNKIRQIVIATQTVSLLAGTTSDNGDDGSGTTATFNVPWGLGVDAIGNLFVADLYKIRKVVIATKEVTTLAGSAAAAWSDGFGTNAAFSRPAGLAMDARGNMLVADSGNHRVRVLQATVPCAPGFYCLPGAERVMCPTCVAGSSAPPAAAITRTTAAWTVGANNNASVDVKCVTNSLGVSASLAFSAISVRVARGVFTTAAYPSAAAPSGSQQGTWLYQGCFTDSAARLFPVQLATSIGPTDAALSCMALARAAGFSVVGFEAWAPPNVECWGLPPDALSDWRTTAVNEVNCGDGGPELPHGLRWGTGNWGIAIYQFNLPVGAGQTYVIMSPGYQSTFTTDHFSWSVVFPSPTSVSVCATAFQRGNTWGDATLKGVLFTF